MNRIQTYLVLLAIGLTCAPAGAQGRIFLPTLPDLDLAGLAAPEWHGDDDLHFEFMGRGETWFDLGHNRDTRGRYAVTGAAGAGWRPSDLTVVMARGDVTGSGDYEGADPSSSLRGWHRVSARTGFGEPGDDPLGIDFTLRYEAIHAGQDGWVLPPSDVAWGENFSDERVDIGLWPRSGEDDELIGLLPMRYAFRNVSYPRGGGPVGGFTTHAFSSGIGIRSYDDEFVEGWWEFVGVTYSRTNYSPPAGVSRAQASSNGGLPQHERIDWRVLSLDRVVLAESDFLVGIDFHLGASWLWDNERDIDHASFTGGFGVRSKFEDGEIGIGVAKQALATADGQRFTDAIRVEGILEVTPPDLGIGAGIRAAYHQFGNDEEGPEPVRSGAIHSRWFLLPTRWSKIGAYHLAHLGARVDGESYDPIHYTGGWSHELGVFLELNDDL